MRIISSVTYILHPPGVTTGRGGDKGRVAHAMIRLRGAELRLVSHLDLTVKVRNMWPEMTDVGAAVSGYMSGPGLFVFEEIVYDDGRMSFELVKATVTLETNKKRKAKKTVKGETT